MRPSIVTYPYLMLDVEIVTNSAEENKRRRKKFMFVVVGAPGGCSSASPSTLFNFEFVIVMHSLAQSISIFLVKENY
jgi:hypothetical protein